MSDQDEEKQMAGVEPMEQSRKAIRHALNTICDDWRKYNLLGNGTQTFDLLTEALATLSGQPLDKLRKDFRPRGKRPADLDGGRFICRDCKAEMQLHYKEGAETPRHCAFCKDGHIDLY